MRSSVLSPCSLALEGWNSDWRGQGCARCTNVRLTNIARASLNIIGRVCPDGMMSLR